MANELAKAMAQILGEVNRIPKNGRNTFQNYSYATEGDALDAIRPLLSSHGIAVFYDAVEVWELDNNRTRVKVAIELVHGESGDSKVTHSFGEARDADKQGRTQDKGIYKAITGAVKYWAFKTFLMSTGDDVEASDHDAPTQPRQKPASKPTAVKAVSKPAKVGSKLADDVKGTIADAITDGLTVDEIRALCKANNLPASSDKFTDKSQLTALAAILQDEIANRKETAA
jgi:hypothetical protein